MHSLKVNWLSLFMGKMSEFGKAILDTCYGINDKKVQVGKDQEKAQSETNSHSKNRGGKKQN